MSAGLLLEDSIAVMVRPRHDDGGVREQLPGAVEHTRRADAHFALLCVKAGTGDEHGERGKETNHSCT